MNADPCHSTASIARGLDGDSLNLDGGFGGEASSVEDEGRPHSAAIIGTPEDFLDARRGFKCEHSIGLVGGPMDAQARVE